MKQEETELTRCVLYQEYFDLLWDARDAMVLAQMVYWQSRVKDFDLYQKELNEKNINHWLEPVELQNWWIYKTNKQLSNEVKIAQEDAIWKSLNKLVKLWFIEKRRNPIHKRDRTNQYRVNIININEELKKLWYSIPNYKYTIPILSVSINSISVAIPETTTETTNISNNINILPNSNEIGQKDKNGLYFSTTKYIKKLEHELDIIYDDIEVQRNWHKPYPKPMYETCMKIVDLCSRRNIEPVFIWEVINKFHYMFTHKWIEVDDLENEYTITDEKDILDVLANERFWEFYYGKK